MVTGGEDGILRVHQCTINEGSKLLSGFETVSIIQTKLIPGFVLKLVQFLAMHTS